MYVSGGKAYRLAEDGTAEAFDHEAARPYSWKLAHDVRPRAGPWESKAATNVTPMARRSSRDK